LGATVADDRVSFSLFSRGAAGVELLLFDYADDALLHLILNGFWEPLEFELPPADHHRPNPWRRWIDTSLPAPHDIVPWESSPSIPGCRYRAAERSVVVLFAGMETSD
jgi:pullulanase/glycogen debranching enzyme